MTGREVPSDTDISVRRRPVSDHSDQRSIYKKLYPSIYSIERRSHTVIFCLKPNMLNDSRRRRSGAPETDRFYTAGSQVIKGAYVCQNRLTMYWFATLIPNFNISQGSPTSPHSPRVYSSPHRVHNSFCSMADQSPLRNLFVVIGVRGTVSCRHI